MPELPEVETVRRGLAPHLTGRLIHRLTVRQPRLRWLVPESLALDYAGQRIISVTRRAKYLVLELDTGHWLIHLGMTGQLSFAPPDRPPGSHDHWDLRLEPLTETRLEIGAATDKAAFEATSLLRYHDPRRFGALLEMQGAPEQHPLLAGLGPEPFDQCLNGDWLAERLHQRRAPIKSLLLDGRLIAGIGNIYANEALFLSRIHPTTPAGQLPPARCQQLIEQMQNVLQRAIDAGGSTIRDFIGGDGRPGYFQFSHTVYGRTGQPCVRCTTPIESLKIGQRQAFFCQKCQPHENNG